MIFRWCWSPWLPIYSGTFLKDLWKLEVTVDEISTDVPLGCPALPFSFVHLHGVLMAAAWLLFFPTGALIGRYYRWTWPVWFVAHIVLQVRWGGVVGKAYRHFVCVPMCVYLVCSASWGAMLVS